MENKAERQMGIIGTDPGLNDRLVVATGERDEEIIVQVEDQGLVRSTGGAVEGDATVDDT